MASAIGDIFGTSRHLSHQNAAKELIVRWNSSDVFAADDLIRAVQNRHNIEFVRRTTDIRFTGRLSVAIFDPTSLTRGRRCFGGNRRHELRRRADYTDEWDHEM